MTIDNSETNVSTHERLLKAESSLWRLIRGNKLYLHFFECIDITIPTTNNRIEGGVNASTKKYVTGS